MIRRLKRVEPELCSLNTQSGLISYHLIRSSRRRTMEITITDASRIRVFAPRFVARQEILHFIHDKAHWIVQKLNETRQLRESIQSRRYDDGHEFLFLGEKYKLHVKEEQVIRSRIRFNGLRWDVMIPFSCEEKERETLVKERLFKWYRAQAKEILGARLFHFTRIMDLVPTHIVIKTQKRIWGSCDYNSQKINLNWQLVFCPVGVIDYVVVHELCHLEVPNHSKKFWRKVEKVLPDYRVRQKWFRTHATDMILP